MRRDSVVEEVRRNRAAIAREHGDDVDAIVAGFQREETSAGNATVSFPPKRFAKRVLRRKSAETRRPNKALQPTSRGKRKAKSKSRSRAARG